MWAGLLLGPSLLGWLWPSGFAAVFPGPSLPALNALSQIGLVLFMFIVGLRLGSHTSGGLRHAAIVTSLTSIAAPFVLGAWLATTLHARLAPAGVGLLPFALFVGAAMSITAFPVLARILVDHQLLNTNLGVIAISCAAFDDVAGWLILAVVMTFAGGNAGGPSVPARMLMLAAYLAVMLFAVRPALRRLVTSRVHMTAPPAERLVVPLLVLLLSAVVTELVGVHALFGAFFAGLIVPRGAGLEEIFVERVEPMTVTLLLPIFFAFTGLRTSVQLVDSLPLVRDAIVILIVAVAAKGGASALAARASGLPWKDAAALGALVNTRGLIELVILNVGLDAGVLAPRIFSMMVLMAVVTTCMTSPLLNALGLATSGRGRAASVET